VTVTGFTLSSGHDSASLLVSVLPVEREKEVLDTFRRHGHELHDYLDQHVRTRTIPFVHLEIDLGEKNRQRMEELLAKDNEEKGKE
jgi:ribosome-binding factor A